MIQQQTMSKSDFVKVLVSNKYDAELTEGVVMVYVNSAEELDKTVAKVKKLMDKHNYHSSFGVRGRTRYEKDRLE